jgi:cobalt/nickel transport system permease protein
MYTVTASLGGILHPLDGRLKTVMSLAAIVLAVVLRHWYLAAGFWFAATLWLLISGMRLPEIAHKMIIPFSIAWVVLLNFIFTYGNVLVAHITIGPWVLPVYQEGIARGFLIMVRILAAVTITALLYFTTTMPEILATLRILKLPRLMVDLADMIYRYITITDQTAHTMRHAQLSRGGDSLPWYKQARDMGMIAGGVMVKALDRSTSIYKAMLSRGFDENSTPPLYYDGGLSKLDLLVGALLCLLLLLIVAADVFVR